VCIPLGFESGTNYKRTSVHGNSEKSSQFSPCKKKVILANPLGSCIIHSMMKNENQPTREDLLELILEHAANQAVRMDPDELKGYSLEGLYDVLLDLEANI
jgi:hypothetical protein